MIVVIVLFVYILFLVFSIVLYWRELLSEFLRYLYNFLSVIERIIVVMKKYTKDMLWRYICPEKQK